MVRFLGVTPHPNWQWQGLMSQIVDAGEWLHYGMKRPRKNHLVVLISQSGESIEVKKLVEEGKVGIEYIGSFNSRKGLTLVLSSEGEIINNC